MQESERCRAFIRSVELGSLGAAAEEMGFSPSTISRMAASLEQEWGVRLMERSRNGLTVTPEGSAMLSLAQAIVCAHRRAAQEAASSGR